MAHLRRALLAMPMLKSPQGSARAGIEPGASRTRSLLTPRIPQHGCESATVTPSGDERLLFPAGSAVLSSGCASGSRVKSGSSRKHKMEVRAAGGAVQRRCGVGRRLQRARVRLCFTSWIVDLAFSARMGMGRRPKHVGTLTLRCTSRGHPPLSLGRNVTAVTAIGTVY